ncbi:cupin domain-containing protein [uncultured Shewanella sp.]|uniref:cupin domain-containing protein n=1 Tax=uncultured Shewanella sp. TaxID=173975 RepID=UPI002617F2EF|nr:cupin domain-containing protein [uncultured Shewanella sp.]
MRTLSIILPSLIFILHSHLTLAETKKNPSSSTQKKHDQHIQLIDANDYAKLLIKTNESWNGALLPDYSAQTPEISVIKLTVPPKSQLPVHQHPSITVAYILKGEFTAILEDNSKKIDLKAGDVDIEVINTWHYGINYSDDPAEILIVFIGTESTPLTINKYNDKP